MIVYYMLKLLVLYQRQGVLTSGLIENLLVPLWLFTCAALTAFRVNTYKMPTLTPFKVNTYKKQGGGE
jgi:uncharacterized membrane protein